MWEKNIERKEEKKKNPNPKRLRQGNKTTDFQHKDKV